MKTFVAIAFALFSFTSSANNVIVNGTRFIYPSNEKEITVQMTNNANRPALIQTWLDNGDPKQSPDDIVTPFVITPPILTIEGKAGQSIRIKVVDDKSIAKDKESLWWINILEIPPSATSPDKKDKNVLQLAIRSRFKFIYRPVGLKGRDDAASKIEVVPTSSGIKMVNPTPFYITVSKINKGSGNPLNSKVVILKPKESQQIELKSSVKSNDKITLDTINDYGADIRTDLTVK